MVRKEKYFSDSGQRLYIDLRWGKGHTGEFERVIPDDSDLTVTVPLKNPATKKIRLCIMEYYQGEYMYMLGGDGLIMNYKEYSVQKPKKKFDLKKW